MLKIKRYFLSSGDSSTGVEEYKVIAFALTMWITVFFVLFVLVPLVFGAGATKPRLFRIFAMMSMPMIFSAGLVGLRSKSKSLKGLLLRALAGGFAGAWLFSIIILAD